MHIERHKQETQLGKERENKAAKRMKANHETGEMVSRKKTNELLSEHSQDPPFLLSTHHSRIGLTSLLLNSLNRSLVPIHTLELVDIRIQLGVISCVDHLQSLLTSLKRERHQDVNSSEIFAAEEASTIGCSGELRFQEIEVSLEVWLEVHGLEPGDNAASDGTDEKGDLVALEDCRSTISQ
jgi:hypothetical protein